VPMESPSENTNQSGLGSFARTTTSADAETDNRLRWFCQRTRRHRAPSVRLGSRLPRDQGIMPWTCAEGPSPLDSRVRGIARLRRRSIAGRVRYA